MGIIRTGLAVGAVFAFGAGCASTERPVTERTTRPTSEAPANLCHMAVGNVIRLGDTVWVQDGYVTRPGGTAVGHAVFMDGGTKIGEPSAKMAPDGEWTIGNIRPTNEVERYIDPRGRYRKEWQATCVLPSGEKRPAEDAIPVTVRGTTYLNRSLEVSFPIPQDLVIGLPTSRQMFGIGALGVSFSKLPSGQQKVE